MKIVINSNISYKLPLKLLLESILKSDIKNISDVIVVLSESDRESTPELKEINSITDIDSSEKVVVIESVRRNYDYCGFDVLYKYYGNKLIDSNEYLYLHDTSTVDSDFYSKITKFADLSEDVIISPLKSNSNIIIFQKNIITKYKDNFSVDMNKYQATWAEVSDGVFVDDRWVTNVLKFGIIKSVDERVLTGHTDIYNTGCCRAILYYKDFGISKYIFWNNDGDIKGKLRGPTLS